MDISGHTDKQLDDMLDEDFHTMLGNLRAERAPAGLRKAYAFSAENYSRMYAAYERACERHDGIRVDEHEDDGVLILTTVDIYHGPLGPSFGRSEEPITDEEWRLLQLRCGLTERLTGVGTGGGAHPVVAPSADPRAHVGYRDGTAGFLRWLLSLAITPECADEGKAVACIGKAFGGSWFAWSVGGATPGTARAFRVDPDDPKGDEKARAAAVAYADKVF